MSRKKLTNWDPTDPANFDPKIHVWKLVRGRMVIRDKQFVAWQRRKNREVNARRGRTEKETKARLKKEREADAALKPHLILKNIFT